MPESNLIQRFEEADVDSSKLYALWKKIQQMFKEEDELWVYKINNNLSDNEVVEIGFTRKGKPNKPSRKYMRDRALKIMREILQEEDIIEVEKKDDMGAIDKKFWRLKEDG